MATLGIFAFLGRKTRLFLSEMGMKDLDEQVKDFLRYIPLYFSMTLPNFSA